MLRGHVPVAVQPWLTGASLVALPKPEGGNRPVAVGETLRRVTGKVLSFQLKEKLRDHLEPVQLGVGTPGGAEAVVHVVRQWVNSHKFCTSKGMLLVDLKNAFNMIDNSAARSAIRELAPEGAACTARFTTSQAISC
jgi:hypothetical protein